MAEFIEILSENALVDLKMANDEIIKMVSNIDKVNAKMKSVSTPSGVDGAVKDLNAQYIRQQKALADLQIKLERYTQAQNRTKISTNALEKSEISLEQARLRNEKALQREQAKLEASTQLYNKVQQKLNTLQTEYKNLAVQKELTGKLTDSEAKRYDFLSGKISKYDTILKGVDASMGKYQRNVGNYASGYNVLGNSVNQLTREFPAFANSVQTGFMAISNNLPIFFDAISQTNRELKALKAQGQEVPSLFSKLGSSIFSWGTALSLGVTLLTVFGAQMWEAISGSKERKIALEKEKEALEKKSKAEDEARDKLARYQSEEISRAKILFENAKNLELPYKKRLEAVTELQKRYPDYLGSLSKEQILAGDTADAEIKLNDALVKRGIALASQQAIQEEINNGLKNEKWITDQLNTIQNQRLSLGKELSKIDPFTKNEDLQQKYNYLTQKLTRLFYLEGTLKEQYQSKNKVIQDSIKFYIEQYNANAKYLDVVHEDTKATEKNTKAKKDNNKELEKKGEFLSKAYLENQISSLEKELTLISKLNPNYQLFNTTLEQTKALYEALYGDGKIKKGQEEVQKGIELTDEAVYADYFAWLKLKEATDNYLKTISSDAFNKAFDNIGLSSAKMFLDFDKEGKSTFDKLIEGADNLKEKFAITFQAVGDLAQDVFNKIMEYSNQRFENEKINLQKEKDIAILFAGESASAKEEINRQYDERQREIRNREAKAKKQQAIFNILIDTAQGIVSALASTPPNVPLSIAIGIIGALQAGIVASQPTPQFYKGTDNAPEGWAWTQEKGAEIITDKNGKLKSTGSNKGAQMTYLNKGDKVFTAEKSRLMFDNGLNNILSSNGISTPKIEVNTPNIDVSGVIKAIENKPTIINEFSQNGIRQLISNGHSRKEITNRRINGIGTNV